ncbi:MAG: hypothetical protein V9G09_07405 [Candidatus Nanopelagicales bacterium]
MRTAILTREWPPFIYGGAGVHVEHLVPELRKIIDVDVHCLGKPREDAQAHQVPDSLLDANPALQTIGADLGMADAVTDCDVAHSHTWYANLVRSSGRIAQRHPARDHGAFLGAAPAVEA